MLAQRITPSISQYIQQTWTLEDGLPQSSVTALHQTRDGYLWIGTQEGVARFDGIDFHTYNAANSALALNAVTSLQETRDGSLWIGTMGGGLTRVQADSMVTYDRNDGLPGDRISALVEDADGRLVAGTYEAGLARWMGDRFEPLLPDDLPLNIVDLALDGNGGLWVASRDQGLFHVRGSLATRISSIPESVALRDIEVGANNVVWVATVESGLYQLAYAGSTTRLLAHFPPGAPMPDEGIRTLLEAPSGDLWMGSGQEGLFRFDGQRSDTYYSADGLAFDNISALLFDREGTLWVGTDGGGLVQFRVGKFITFTEQEGLGANPVWSITEDRDGGIWMGTEGGGLTRYINGDLTTYTTANGLASDLIIAVLGTQDGSVWVGTYGEGLQRFSQGRFRTYGPESGFNARSVFALYEDREGVLWIGTQEGVYRFVDDQFTLISTEQGLSNNLITIVSEDKAGRTLVGTYEGGVNVLEDGAVVEQITVEQGLESNTVLSLYAEEHALWIGTQGGGLARYDGEVRTITARDGLYSDAIFALLPDASGQLWMTSNTGLARVALDTLHAVADGMLAKFEMSTYDKTDGLRSPEFNGGVQPAGIRDGQGRLWLPSIAGAVVFNPDSLRYNEQAPPVHIEHFLVDDTEIKQTSLIKVASRSQRFEFDFAAATFIAPGAVRYRYQLEGLDADWIDAEDRRNAFYTNLEPGSYTFRVIASNSDGVWNEEGDALSFYLAPRYFQTWWFRLLLAFAIVGLIFGSSALRVRTLKARHDALERMVTSRTAELTDANEALAEASETKSQLMRLVAHDLKNPLGGVREFAKVLRSELSSGSAPDITSHSEILEMIESTADHALEMVTQFLDVEALESGQLDFAPTSVDLVRISQASLDRFLSQATRKGQRLHAPGSSVPLYVRADPNWLPVVLDNLVSNAVKYTPPERDIWVSISKSEDTGVLRVRDEGPGLSESDQAKLFGKFQKLTAQPTGGESSTGLGLSIVKMVVEGHGGQIRAESELGHGTTFIVEFPLADPPEDAASTYELPEEDLRRANWVAAMPQRKASSVEAGAAVAEADELADESDTRTGTSSETAEMPQFVSFDSLI